jgi:protease-4
MIFAIILLVLLGISFLFNLLNLAGGALHGRSSYSRSSSGPRLEEVVKEDNDSLNKIAVIEVNGIITGGNIDQSGYNIVDVLRAQLRRAMEDDRVKAVILKVDSPGGEVMAADEMHHAINDFQTKSSKPVIASMGSLAASGGYYISAPCRWIVASDLTITGSIGVILSAYNYRGLMDKVGVLPQTYKSGKFKDMLSGSREPDQITPEEKAMVQGLIDETYAKFKKVVKDGRDQARQQNKSQGRTLVSDWADYADGRVLSGTEAYKLGFVDELGYFKDAVARAEVIAGISKANLVEYQQRFDLSDIFRIFGKSDAKKLKIDLGMEFPKVEAGRLYFLSSTVLQ